MGNLDDYLAANDLFVAEKFTAEDGAKPMPPARKTAIITCMDARVHPEAALGLAIGDSHVIRNAGGRASADALRSVTISQQLLGTTEVIILHHTDCGMLTFDNDTIHKKIEADLNADASHIDFLPFADLEQSVRDDVAAVKSSPFVLPDTPVHGGIYDVATGKVTLID